MFLPGLEFPCSVPLPPVMFTGHDELYYDSLLGVYTTPRGARGMRRTYSGSKPLFNRDM